MRGAQIANDWARAVVLAVFGGLACAIAFAVAGFFGAAVYLTQQHAKKLRTEVAGYGARPRSVKKL